MAVTNPAVDLSRASVELATKLAQISFDSAEKALAVQIEYAKGALEQANLNAKAVSSARDVESLLALRTRIAENALENMMGYSRSLYEVASEAQSAYSKLAEERVADLQATLAKTVEEAAKSAPAGGDVAVAAVKSQLAAATAAYDTLTKAARGMASFADAGVSAVRPTRAKK